MHKQVTSRPRRALLLLTLVLALGAFAAANASASVVAAKWGESTFELRFQGSLKVENQWGEKATCSGETKHPYYTNASPGSSVFTAYNSTNSYFAAPVVVMTFACGTNTLEIPLSPNTSVGFYGSAQYDTVTGSYFLTNSGFETTEAGFGSGISGQKYAAAPLKVELRNPDAKNPTSRLIFSNTLLGKSGLGGQMRATGTLTVDDTTGKPRTLSH